MSTAAGLEGEPELRRVHLGKEAHVGEMFTGRVILLSSYSYAGLTCPQVITMNTSQPIPIGRCGPEGPCEHWGAKGLHILPATCGVGLSSGTYCGGEGRLWEAPSAPLRVDPVWVSSPSPARCQDLLQGLRQGWGRGPGRAWKVGAGKPPVCERRAAEGS